MNTIKNYKAGLALALACFIAAPMAAAQNGQQSAWRELIGGFYTGARPIICVALPIAAVCGITALRDYGVKKACKDIMDTVWGYIPSWKSVASESAEKKPAEKAEQTSTKKHCTTCKAETIHLKTDKPDVFACFSCIANKKQPQQQAAAAATPAAAQQPKQPQEAAPQPPKIDKAPKASKPNIKRCETCKADTVHLKQSGSDELTICYPCMFNKKPQPASAAAAKTAVDQAAAGNKPRQR